MGAQAKTKRQTRTGTEGIKKTFFYCLLDARHRGDKMDAIEITMVVIKALMAVIKAMMMVIMLPSCRASRRRKKCALLVTTPSLILASRRGHRGVASSPSKNRHMGESRGRAVLLPQKRKHKSRSG